MGDAPIDDLSVAIVGDAPIDEIDDLSVAHAPEEGVHTTAQVTGSLEPHNTELEGIHTTAQVTGSLGPHGMPVRVKSKRFHNVPPPSSLREGKIMTSHDLEGVHTTAQVSGFQPLEEDEDPFGYNNQHVFESFLDEDEDPFGHNEQPVFESNDTMNTNAAPDDEPTELPETAEAAFRRKVAEFLSAATEATE